MRREYPCRPIVGVGQLLWIMAGLFLLWWVLSLRWASGVFRGAVELGETVRSAVILEAKEECGLDVELVEDTPMDAYDILKLDEDDRLWYHYVLLQFLVQPKDGALKPTRDVTQTPDGFPLKEVENYELTESVRCFFRKHRNKLEKHS